MILPPETIIILAVSLIIVAVTWWHHARSLAGYVPTCRPLLPFDEMRAALGRGAETGRAIHISPGAGSIGDGYTMAETTAGLLAAERVVNEAAIKGAPVLVSSGDATAHLALRGMLRQAYQRAGRAHDYDPSTIQLLSHRNQTAYVTGVVTLYTRQPLEASQALGSFRHEFLLFGEEGAIRGLPQILGATSMNALPLMKLTTESTLVGEEIFGAEAYLSNSTIPQARLMTQDLLRTAVILLLVVGIIYVLVQQQLPQYQLPPLPGA